MKTKVRKIGSKVYDDGDKSVVWSGEMEMLSAKVTHIVIEKIPCKVGETYIEIGDANFADSICQVIFIH
jgi:hypothetical protein